VLPRLACVVVILVVACGKERPTPAIRSQLRFRGEGKHVAALRDGSVIVAGAFAMTTTVGDKTLTSSDDSVHGLLIRLTPDGHVVWAETAGGPFSKALLADGDEFVVVEEAGSHNRLARFRGDGTLAWEVPWDKAYPAGGAIDGEGNVYVTGTVTESVTIGEHAIEAAGDQNVYVAAFDRQGKVRWAHTIPSAGHAAYTSIAMMGTQLALAVVRWDDAGGRTGKIMILDSTGAAVREIPFGDVELPAVVVGYRDGLLLATDAPPQITAYDQALHVRWQRRLGASINMIRAIASDEHTITVAGQLLGRLDWGEGFVQAADHNGDTFIGALRDDGTPTWLVHGAGKGVDFAADVVESDHRLWITGAFDQPLQFTRAREPLASEGDGIQSGFVMGLELPR
jgi:hypothetical protein